MRAYLLCFVWVAACSSDNNNCDPVAQSGCDNGLSCEEVVNGGAPVCATPVVVQGSIFDLADSSAVAGARVVALDVNASPQSSVVISGADGAYELRVPTVRNPDGTPAVTKDITLRVDAAAYETFPLGFRQALPIDTAGAVAQGGKLVIASALTDVGLIALGAGAGTASIAGHVSVPDSQVGVLVVAQSADGGTSAIADTHGDYEIFNLAPGDYTVIAYAKGLNYNIGQVTLAAGQASTIDLTVQPERPTATFNGTLQFVNPGSGMTSVTLVVKSTFDQATLRGDSPPGLRAPAPGIAPNVTGSFTIEGVPDGTYLVLAAFENDGFVRDPDTNIGGTDIIQVQVVNGSVTNAPASFKVTGALQIFSPGANGAESVSAPPTLSWMDDSSEDEYDVIVYNALGENVWEVTEPRHTGDNPSLPYGGPLESGMYYQFRAISIKNGVPISATEDLRGVFYVP